MQPTLADLESLARAAGDILRSGFGSDFGSGLGAGLRSGFGQDQRVRYKGAIDLVTEYDGLSEAYLLGQIQSRFPGHRLVAEESGVHSGSDCCQWVIDPLDGTVNFAHGVPIFCVSLAYVADGVLKLGVVYSPILDECFSAEREKGARLNGRSIQVSSASELDHSLLVTGFGYDIRTNPVDNLSQFGRLSRLSQGVRRLGSAALDLCYVAAGRFDGYWELALKPWDVAAGGLIAEEAGARVSKVDGDLAYLTPPCSVVAANPQVYPELFQALHHEVSQAE